MSRRVHTFREWFASAQPSTALPSTNRRYPILVIGAGPAGLAMMRALKERGIEFEAVERHDSLGGMWDSSNPLSVAYDNLVTIGSKGTMSLGNSFPAATPSYIPKDLALKYLRGYAKKYSLVDKIQLGTEVRNITKASDGTWHVAGRSYRAVIVASGFHNRQNERYPKALWEACEQNGIERLHSGEYRNAERFSGKRVVILGMGNSAADIAKEVSRVAARTLLAVRTTPWISPLWVGPIPTDVFAKGHLLPHSLEVRLWSYLQRRLVGHPSEDLGFAPPTHELMERLPVVDRGLVSALKSNSVIIRSSINRIEKGQVYFDSNEQPPESIDVLVFATGFERQFPFLRPDPYADFEKTKPRPQFFLFHPKETGVAFMTETTVPQGAWPIFWEQAQAIGDYFEAETKNPFRTAAFNARRESASPDFKGPIFGKADDFHVDPEIYTKVLRDFRRWILA